jgi:hypothetical protein
VTATDNSAVVTKAIPLKEEYFRQSVLAEHGFRRRWPRYLKVTVRNMKILFSPLSREQIAAAGLTLTESPSPLLRL